MSQAPAELLFSILCDSLLPLRTSVTAMLPLNHQNTGHDPVEACTYLSEPYTLKLLLGLRPHIPIKKLIKKKKKFPSPRLDLVRSGLNGRAQTNPPGVSNHPPHLILPKVSELRKVHFKRNS